MTRTVSPRPPSLRFCPADTLIAVLDRAMPEPCVLLRKNRRHRRSYG